jgi:hypothetical protein
MPRKTAPKVNGSFDLLVEKVCEAILDADIVSRVWERMGEDFDHRLAALEESVLDNTIGVQVVSDDPAPVKPKAGKRTKKAAASPKVNVNITKSDKTSLSVAEDKARSRRSRKQANAGSKTPRRNPSDWVVRTDWKGDAPSERAVEQAKSFGIAAKLRKDKFTCLKALGEAKVKAGEFKKVVVL